MLQIQEISCGKNKKYNIYNKSTTLQLIKTVFLYTCEHEYNNNKFFMLFNSNGRLIEPVFRFLNIECKHKAVNTKKQILYALKTLYSFIDIFDINIKTFDIDNLRMLNSFLYGEIRIGENIELSLQSNVSKSTVIKYFEIYHEYFDYLNLDVSSFETNKFHQNYISINSQKISPATLCPKFFNDDEVLKILKTIYDNDNYEMSIRNECIILLMYECGLRIGEVLGLTLEDVKDLCQTSNEDIFISTVIIRNRKSDKKDQSAKTCMKVFDINVYKKKEYRTESIGYQKCFISEYLYNKINEYIEISHNRAYKKNKKIFASCIADSVESIDKNYYIFINEKGNRLSQALWNQELRNILIDSNIPIDYNEKSIGLNHRFRHGFIMKLIYVKKYRLEVVMKLSRHRSITSLSKYNNPTEEQLIDIQLDLEEHYGKFGRIKDYYEGKE